MPNSGFEEISNDLDILWKVFEPNDAQFDRTVAFFDVFSDIFSIIAAVQAKLEPKLTTLNHMNYPVAFIHHVFESRDKTAKPVSAPAIEILLDPLKELEIAVPKYLMQLATDIPRQAAAAAPAKQQGMRRATRQQTTGKDKTCRPSASNAAPPGSGRRLLIPLAMSLPRRVGKDYTSHSILSLESNFPEEYNDYSEAEGTLPGEDSVVSSVLIVPHNIPELTLHSRTEMQVPEFRQARDGTPFKPHMPYAASCHSQLRLARVGRMEGLTRHSHISLPPYHNEKLVAAVIKGGYEVNSLTTMLLNIRRLLFRASTVSKISPDFRSFGQMWHKLTGDDPHSFPEVGNSESQIGDTDPEDSLKLRKAVETGEVDPRSGFIPPEDREIDLQLFDRSTFIDAGRFVEDNDEKEDDVGGDGTTPVSPPLTVMSYELCSPAPTPPTHMFTPPTPVPVDPRVSTHHNVHSHGALGVSPPPFKRAHHRHSRGSVRVVKSLRLDGLSQLVDSLKTATSDSKPIPISVTAEIREAARQVCSAVGIDSQELYVPGWDQLLVEVDSSPLQCMATGALKQMITLVLKARNKQMKMARRKQ